MNCSTEIRLLILLFVSSSLFLLTPFVHANDVGTYQESNDIKTNSQINSKYEDFKCCQSPDYFVIEASLIDSVGSDILVKYKKDYSEEIECKYILGPTDFEIRNEWAEYFMGICNHFLLLDSGTGPLPRDLIIYDLSKREKHYETSYSCPVEYISDSKLSFWLESEEIAATPNNCPESTKWIKQGLGAAIEERVILDLKTLSLKKTGNFRCRSRQ